MRGFNEDQILNFVDLTRDSPIDVRFIEYMPFQGNKWNENTMMSYQEMKDLIRKTYPDFHAIPNEPNNTSKVKLNY